MPLSNLFRHQMPAGALDRAGNPAWRLMIGYGHSRADASNNALHFDKVCSIGIPRDGIYSAAFERWKRLWLPIAGNGAPPAQVRTLRLEHRALVGMSEPSLWESGITLNPVYGTPLLPGSACKGLALHFATSSLGIVKEHLNGVFDSRNLDRKVDFLDAWWCPGSSPGTDKSEQARPLVREQTTPHHPGFLRTKGGAPATPFDSPVPVPQIATHGSFLFVVKGPPLWATYAMDILQLALEFEGIGARTPEYGSVASAVAPPTPGARERRQQ